MEIQTDSDEEYSPTKNTRKRSRVAGDNVVVDKLIKKSKLTGQVFSDLCGKVKRVRLKNFMCHSNFEFVFGEGINFISGKNGSGKSAILTALVVGLGGRTSDTNRGHSISQLIKSGQSRCSIEITLTNSGPQNYYVEKYGDEITIMRSISENGSSSYKLIPKKGPSSPLKKEDLMIILLSFNIQITNPVCILNQDTARTFLKTATPKDLYILYRKGTLFDHMEEKINTLKNELLPDIRAIIARRKEAAEGGAKDLIDFLAKYENFKLYKKICQEEMVIKQHLTWIYVYELEKHRDKIKHSVQENKKVVEQYKSSLEKDQTHWEELKSRNTLLEQEQQNLKAESDLKFEQGIDFQQKLSYHNELNNKKKNDMNNIKKRITNETKHCETICGEIENRTKRSAEIAAERETMIQQMNILTKRCADLKSVKSTVEVHKQQMQDTLSEITSESEKVKQNNSSLDRKICTQKNYLNHLKSSTNSFIIFGKWMPQFLQAIEAKIKDNQFERRPLGPIGSYIKLKDKTWGVAIESILGYSFLQSFCVDNTKDYAVLLELTKACNLPKHQIPAIYISKFFLKVHDVSKTETTHSQFKSLLSSIDISNPVITNLIIDHTQADTVLLIPSNKEAFPLMENRNCVPRNCKKALTKMGDIFYPSPNYKSYAGNIAENVRFLQVSTDDAVRMTEIELKNLIKLFEMSKNEIFSYRTKQKEAQMKLDAANKELANVTKQILACEEKICNLKDLELPESYNSDNMLREDLELRKDLIKTLQSEIVKINNESNQIAIQCQTLEKEKQHMEHLQKEILDQIHIKEQEVKANKLELKKFNLSRERFQQLLKTQVDRLQVFSSKLLEVEEQYNSALVEATNICPEKLSSTKTKGELEVQMEKILVAKRNFSSHYGTEEPQAPEKHEERMAYFNAILEDLKSLSAFSQNVEGYIDIITERLIQVNSFISASIKQAFKSIIKLRNFEGGISINNETHALNITIHPEDTKSKSAITTLSGGERSFSMVAFIMALWNNMTTPFYFLDEFDVFMDEVNRKLIMDLLIMHARLKPHKQFVFLTPHATYEKGATDIHFFRMDDPRKT